MSIRVHHEKGVIEPEWQAIKLRKSLESKYHIAMHLKHHGNLHLKFRLRKNDRVVPVWIDYSHTKTPEEFWANIMKIGLKKHMIIQNLPRFIAHKIVIDLSRVDKSAKIAKTDAEFEKMSKELFKNWKIQRKNTLQIIFAHIGDLHRLGKESRTLLKELQKVAHGIS